MRPPCLRLPISSRAMLRSVSLTLNSSLRVSLIVYSSIFYEGHRLKRGEDGIFFAPDEPTRFKRDFGLDVGTEFKFGSGLDYILKANYTVFSETKEDTFNISMTFPLSQR